MRYLLIFSLIIVTAISCSTKKQSTITNPPKISDCREMILLEKPIDSLRFDYYDVDSVMINGQCLDFVVNYGGGCGEANFELYFTDQIMESMPPQATIYLTFEDNDPCRSIVTRKISFSLLPFKKFADRGGVYFVIYGKEKSILYQIPK